MKITRIDFASSDARTFASVTRKIGSPTITATILTAGKETEIPADAADRDSVFALAACVQSAIDGCRGTNSMIHDYFRLIEQLAD